MIVLAFMSAETAAQEKGTVAVIGTGDMGDSLGPRDAANLAEMPGPHDPIEPCQ
jgi:hypothetical protein